MKQFDTSRIDDSEFEELIREFTLNNDSSSANEALEIGMEYSANNEVKIDKAKEAEMLAKLKNSTSGKGLGMAGQIFSVVALLGIGLASFYLINNNTKTKEEFGNNITINKRSNTLSAEPLQNEIAIDNNVFDMDLQEVVKEKTVTKTVSGKTTKTTERKPIVVKEEPVTKEEEEELTEVKTITKEDNKSSLVEKVKDKVTEKVKKKTSGGIAVYGGESGSGVVPNSIARGRNSASFGNPRANRWEKFEGDYVCSNSKLAVKFKGKDKVLIGKSRNFNKIIIGGIKTNGTAVPFDLRNDLNIRFTYENDTINGFVYTEGIKEYVFVKKEAK